MKPNEEKNENHNKGFKKPDIIKTVYISLILDNVLLKIKKRNQSMKKNILIVIKRRVEAK